MGTERGEHLSGRARARAASVPASRPGMGAVPHAHPQPLYVRIGGAPGRRDHGGARSQRSARDSRARGRMTAYDVIIVGAGHNGLVTAAVLAQTGLRTLVLERRARVGGAAITEELHPGFRVSTLAHTVH